MDTDEKKIRIEIVNANVDGIEDVKEVVKSIGALAENYRKLYDSIKIEIVDKNKNDINTKEIVLSGIRSEKEEEKESRLGIDTKSENSWKCKYSKLVGCSKKDAEENMNNMLQENLMLTPEEWLTHKKKKIEDFFNVGKSTNKSS